MLKIIFSLLLSLAIFAARAQNTGVGNTNPQATLDVSGDIATRMANMSLVNGVNNDVISSSDRRSIYRVVTPTAAFSITGMDGGVDGRTVTLINTTTFEMTLVNESPLSTDVNRILTSNGVDIVIPAKGAATLQYSPTEQRWFVTGKSFTQGGAVSGGWGLSGNSGNTTANFIGNTDDVPLLIKTNNTRIAQFDGVKNNVFMGVNSAINAEPAAVSTIAIGQAAGYGTNGTGNIYMGFAAGYFHRNGNDNILIGNNNDLNGNVTDNISNSVSIGTNVHVFESNRIKIGNSIQNTGIGLLVNQTPDHTLVVGKRRQSGPDVNAGALAILGSSYNSHFNYGNTEDTYIRGGKLLGRVYVNEQNGGDVILGSPTTSQIGIGTATPDVNARATIQTAMDYTTALVIRNPSNSIELKTYLGGVINGNTVSIGTTGNNPIALYTNSANRIFIDGFGSVGIGTDNPGIYRLAVNGSIRAKELRINTGWADYVFEKDYQLKPLAEVEQFIKVNHHLPGIPAAAILQKEGVDVSDMQTKMMAKIEELTLYLIEANKKIEALEKKQARQ
jgi:hypothetical protein